MQTRSSSRLVSNPSSNLTPSTNPNLKGRNHRCSKQRIEEFNLDELSPLIVTMADQRTMAQLLQAPTKGYEDTIVVPAITTDNFKLKHGLLTLVQNKQFFGHNKEDPHAHVRYFKKITFTLKFPNVSNTEAWDRFKDLFQACPHHGFSKLHHLDTFYNALNSKDQDSLNSATGGNFLGKMPRECLAIIESKYKVHYSHNKPVVAKVSMNTSTFVEEICVTCGGAHSYRNYPATDGNVYHDNIKEFVSQASAVIYNQGNTSYRPVYQPPVFQPPAYQAPAYQTPAPQTQGVSKEDFLAYVKANDAVMRNMQTQGQNMQNQLTNLTELITKFVNSNTASTSSSGTHPSNTIANPRSDLKEITTQSGVSYDGPQILPPPSFLPTVVKDEPEATKDTVHLTNNGSTGDVQPQAVQSESLILNSELVTSSISEPIIALISTPKHNPKSSIPYPSRRNDERNREKANNQIEKFFQVFKDISFKISFVDALILMPKFASTLKALIGNKEKWSEMARTPLNEHRSVVLLKILPEKLGDPGKFLIPCDFPGMAECLALAVLGASINLMPFFAWKILSLPDLTTTCMNLELSDRSISHPVGVAEDVYVKVGSFHFPADFVVVDFDADPPVPLILGRLFLKTGRALIDVFEGSSGFFFDVIASGNPTPYNDPIVSTTSSTLTPFGNSDFLLEEVDAFLAVEDDPTSPEVYQPYLDPEGEILLLEAFLNDDASLPPPNQGNYLPEVRKELKICEAKSDKSSIDEPPEVEIKDLPTHIEYAFLEGDDKFPVIIAKDLSVEEKTALITVLKSHKRAIAWKLYDIKGIDPEFCTHKILMEEDFEPTVQHQRRVNPKLHDVIKQEEKTTFTCPYEMFAYRRMPFGLCNAPSTFQRCMMAIFHDMIEKTMEVFMDDFSVFRNSFQSCLSHLEWMLKRCEDINLCINWEKSHFMVKEGIVLGYKISKQGIEVDKAKVDVITKYLTQQLSREFTFKVIDTKGAKNMAANHLSRLENPHKNVLDPKEINESFPLETLNLVSTREGVYQAKKPLKFSRLATIDPQGDTMAQITQPKRKVQINELNKLCDQAYKNSLIYKEKTKRLHDSKIKDRVFNIGDRVLLFNSCLKIFSCKLKSHWSGPFTISQVYPYGTVELSQPDGPNFKVNGHRVKHYFRDDVPKLVVPDLQTFPMDH
nr:hypothetical protein [Tanacetum cinerariifolium]